MSACRSDDKFGNNVASIDEGFGWNCISPLSSPVTIPRALLDSPLLFDDSQVSSSNQHLGYGAGSPQWQSMFQMQMELDDPVSFPKQEGRMCTNGLPMDIESSENTAPKAMPKADQLQHFVENQTQLQQLPEGDQAGVTGIVSSSDDGYNWRKYGQKQVKGSEYPRSYYRCTHSTCQVKKKVERALDDQITEIIYIGSHNHPKPQPTHQSAFGSSYKVDDMASDSTIGPSKDLKANFQEMASSRYLVTKPSHVRANYSSLHADDSHLSTLRSQNENDDKSESKKRKKENCFAEKTPMSQSLHQPRVVVQTVSEVDILEDGYRWRKYGQKIVKGNPNPRSYYKCTALGCSVRKHIERAADDIRSVITSYEGKHNHEVPGARNSNNICSDSNTQFPALNSQTPFTASVPTISKPETHDLVPRFGNNFKICSEYLTASSLLRVTDSEASILSLYQMMLQPSLPLPSVAFGLNNSNAQQVIPMANIAQELPISNPNGRSNFAMAGHYLFGLGSIAPDIYSRAGCEPKKDMMMTLSNPKPEMHTYDSPESTLCYGQFSPPLSSLSDGQPSNS